MKSQPSAFLPAPPSHCRVEENRIAFYYLCSSQASGGHIDRSGGIANTGPVFTWYAINAHICSIPQH